MKPIRKTYSVICKPTRSWSGARIVPRLIIRTALKNLAWLQRIARDLGGHLEVAR